MPARWNRERSMTLSCHIDIIVSIVDYSTGFDFVTTFYFTLPVESTATDDCLRNVRLKTCEMQPVASR